jgi:hypothetical protein
LQHNACEALGQCVVNLAGHAVAFLQHGQVSAFVEQAGVLHRDCKLVCQRFDGGHIGAVESS